MKKFVVKFTNGYWKVFDTEQYTDVAICGLQSEAEVQAANRNAARILRNSK